MKDVVVRKLKDKSDEINLKISELDKILCHEIKEKEFFKGLFEDILTSRRGIEKFRIKIAKIEEILQA